jgi:hypothetical protein
MISSFGLTGQVAHDVELGPQRQALALMRLRQLDRGPDELSLADVLDGGVAVAGD